MRVAFLIDRDGYAQARADPPFVVLSSMLESDLQDALTIRDVLGDLRQALAGGARVEITGNSHTISVNSATASVACDAAPSIPTVSVATKDLIELIVAWQGFRVRGRPTGWPDSGPERASVAGPPT